MRLGRFTLLIVLGTGLLLSGACSRAQALEEIPKGTEVVVKLDDGAIVRGRLVTVEPDTIVIEQESTGKPKSIVRETVVQVEQPGAAGDRSLGARLLSGEPEFDDVTIPSGTVIDVELETSVSSDASSVEDVVRGVRRAPVMVDNHEVLPTGTQFVGTVDRAVPSGKVKGRAQLAFSFEKIVTPGETYEVATRPFDYVAKGTKDEDALKIGAGAVAGAIIGGLAGGGDGAAAGAAIGGGAGTAVVLATAGDEVRVGSGTTLKVQLTRPLTVRVPHSSSVD